MAGWNRPCSQLAQAAAPSVAVCPTTPHFPAGQDEPEHASWEESGVYCPA